jgi:hypothetical protein
MDGKVGCPTFCSQDVMGSGHTDAIAVAVAVAVVFPAFAVAVVFPAFDPPLPNSPLVFFFFYI